MSCVGVTVLYLGFNLHRLPPQLIILLAVNCMILYHTEDVFHTSLHQDAVRYSFLSFPALFPVDCLLTDTILVCWTLGVTMSSQYLFIDFSLSLDDLKRTYSIPYLPSVDSSVV